LYDYYRLEPADRPDRVTALALLGVPGNVLTTQPPLALRLASVRGLVCHPPVPSSLPPFAGRTTCRLTLHPDPTPLVSFPDPEHQARTGADLAAGTTKAGNPG
jgi:hypothetical protein